jgi:hypothetical protein
VSSPSQLAKSADRAVIALPDFIFLVFFIAAALLRNGIALPMW